MKEECKEQALEYIHIIQNLTADMKNISSSLSSRQRREEIARIIDLSQADLLNDSDFKRIPRVERQGLADTIGRLKEEMGTKFATTQAVILIVQSYQDLIETGVVHNLLYEHAKCECNLGK